MSFTKTMMAFHAHLDVCKQCRDNPFGLCRIGEPLLLATAEEDAIIGAHKLFGLEAPGQRQGVEQSGKDT